MHKPTTILKCGVVRGHRIFPHCISMDKSANILMKHTHMDILAIMTHDNQ